MKSMKATCFFANQISKTNVESTTTVTSSDDNGLKKSKITQHGGSQTSSVKVAKPSDRTNLHLDHVPSDETDLLIETLNSANLGWKADTCKLSKPHKLYGIGSANCKKTNDQTLTLAQTSSGESESMELESESFGQTSAFSGVLLKAQSWAKSYASAESIPDDKLPDNYDFRNLDGVDFTNPVRDQGHCGSCYTVAFAQAVESRLKLKYGKKVPVLSSQQIMTCNFLNEGCGGGWPHLNGYFMEHGHMVSDQCAPYKGNTKGKSCQDYQKCPPIAKVQKTRFVGGGWGEVSEKQIMKEMIRNGPVSAEFQATPLFSMYAEGILSESGIQSLESMKSQLAQAKDMMKTATPEDAAQLQSVISALQEGGPTEESMLQLQSQMSLSKDNLSDKTLEDLGFSW